jgi:sulfur relay (sulfurtransferase) complex TusBCD TusD component (DsrE family)
MKASSIVKDPPYGPERIYNALPISNALTNKDPSVEVTLLSDGVTVLAAKGSHGARVYLQVRAEAEAEASALRRIVCRAAPAWRRQA